jgi:hypothetical protein
MGQTFMLVPKKVPETYALLAKIGDTNLRLVPLWTAHWLMNEYSPTSLGRDKKFCKAR